MKISAVVATYNRREALRCCLTSLFNQDVPAESYEIVVVLDGCTDGTSEMLNSLRSLREFVVIEQENRGKAAAVNAAVDAASGEIILILDDDLVCDRGMIAAHTAAHASGPPALVFGRMQVDMGRRTSVAERFIYENYERYYLRLETDSHPIWPDDAFAGPNCSLPREVFRAVGGFDDMLFGRRGEDVELGLRLWKAGVCFRYEPRAITWHSWVKSHRAFWNDAAEDGASTVRLCRKHLEMRSRTGLAGTVNASAWKLFVAKVAATSGLVIPKLVGGVVPSLFERLKFLPAAERIAARLFSAAQGMAMLAGARREAGSWRQLTRLFRVRPAVLLYHHVGFATEVTQKLSLTISPAKFARQMRWLRWRGYTTITPEQWLAWYARGESLPEKPILLTFDDAYADLLKYALPVLERHGMRSVIYVITGKLGESDTWEGLPVMTMEQIRYLGGHGVEIGAHTRTHPDLTAASDQALADEVTGSKEDLIDAGLSPVSFAYPYGCFDERVRKAVEGKFPLAFTCEEGSNDLQADPLLLKRTMVHPYDTLLDIELRAAFGKNPLDWVRSRVRFRTRLKSVLRHLGLLAD
jgi:GT2 family glycosyltransferase/peptidoglycan/xylan/chitin deacetylase (PgdA/CDA1 family)